MKALVTGSNGQLGRALQTVFEGKFVDVQELDITNKEMVLATDVNDYSVIINAAAYTNVDAAEAPENYRAVMDVNVIGTANLALLAQKNDLPFIHISTDYVFDGSKTGAYTENDLPNPVNIYGYSKLLSERAATLAQRHYIVRTSWVIGDGSNFVRTMLNLAESKDKLEIVEDQIGRPTFTSTLAKGIDELIEKGADYGIYNLSNDGDPISWADFAKETFKMAGKKTKVHGVKTADYFKDKPQAAMRPLNSIYDLSKIRSSGVLPTDWRQELQAYINNEQGAQQ